ncbi:hypothetical protein LINPERHAP1_LOCUS31195 [Linum perenne]
MCKTATNSSVSNEWQNNCPHISHMPLRLGGL